MHSKKAVVMGLDEVLSRVPFKVELASYCVQFHERNECGACTILVSPMLPSPSTGTARSGWSGTGCYAGDLSRWDDRQSHLLRVAIGLRVGISGTGTGIS
ncbi:hypothetical protein [Micromonospora sp. U21]|uniref:hypothetical protein n=1 Tax=Micromonospora sp. U21 TaxID=2824899 RepID=UPI001B37EFC6|nr:hypothetical protein [Micromonospora sp. U21]MBQ0906895.1 hypothetical protein [Micromonospora sp. U21]